MSFLKGLFGKGAKRERQDSVPTTNPEEQKVLDLLSKLSGGFGSEIQESRQTLLSMGPQVVPHLLKYIEKNNSILALPVSMARDDEITKVERALQILGDIADERATPALERMTSSPAPEFAKAAKTALASIQARKGELRIDSERPFEQISQLWTAIFQGRRDLYTPEVLGDYCRHAIEEMDSLRFASTEAKAKAWSMLGSLLYKSVYPSWTGSYEVKGRCPEAKKCYEEALRITQEQKKNDYWNAMLEKF